MVHQGLPAGIVTPGAAGVNQTLTVAGRRLVQYLETLYALDAIRLVCFREVLTMCAVAATPALSVEQYLALPDHDRFELVDGQLVEVTMSKESSWIGGRLHRLLDVHVDANGLGYVWPADNLYRCFPSQPGRIRKPDVSFIRRERTSWDEPDEGVVTIAPDLVAEVVSPNDLAFEVEEKIGDYLDAGTRLVWVVFPRSRMVYVYRADRSGSILRSQDELSGEDVVPGFVCPVSALFPPTNGSTEPPAGASPR